tara:strand:+ start:1869 stop:2009 length:141 start_codon:yes stop_codon:yes gene_type:complete
MVQEKPFKEPKEVREPKAKKCVVKECICEGSRDIFCCKHGDADYIC